MEQYVLKTVLQNTHIQLHTQTVILTDFYLWVIRFKGQFGFCMLFFFVSHIFHHEHISFLAGSGGRGGCHWVF